VPEEQVDQLLLGGGADTATPRIGQQPDPDDRVSGAVVGSPPLPDPADHADQLAVRLDGEVALVVQPGRRRGGEPGCRAEVVVLRLRLDGGGELALLERPQPDLHTHGVTVVRVSRAGSTTGAEDAVIVGTTGDIGSPVTACDQMGGCG
jgi:hypothetical protein